MEEYTLRSTRTHRASALRRAADILVILLLCAGLLVLLFKVLLVPVTVERALTSELEEGDLVLVDRFSRYISDYKLGDIVSASPEAGEGQYRVAALGGQTYLVSGAKAYLDGGLIDESGYSAGWPEGAELSFEVPEDCVLLLPDFRDGISDLAPYSVLYNDIYGEVRVRVAPITKLALFF